MTQPDSSPISSEPSAKLPGVAIFQRSFFPGRWFWISIGVGCSAVLIARLVSDDESIMNIALMVVVPIGLVTLVIWFAFFSALALRIRVVGMLVFALVASVLASQFQIVRFSGSLFPEIGRRKPPADAQLGRLLPSGVADISTPTDQDFPQFLGPHRDGILGQVQLARDWQQHPPQLLWSRPIGAGWSSFAVVNGFAVTLEQRGEEELVACYRVIDGEPVWSNAVSARHESALGFVGPRSTPTIHEGRVYVMGATGILRCLDGETGHTIWQRDLLREQRISQGEAESRVAWGRAGSPLVVDDKLIVPLGGARPPVSLLAVNLQTGETIWQGGSHEVSYASPVLATLLGQRQILSVNEDFVTAHDVDTGVVLWQHPWPGKSNTDANCSQPVAVDDRRVFLSKGYSKGAELLELEHDAALQWQVTSLWQQRVMKTKFSNVLIHEGYVYGLDDGILSCVDLGSGERRWKKGRYGYGQNLLVDNLIIVLAENGDLALVEANPQRYTELARVSALKGQTWNNPVLAGNRLLMRNSEEAACYEIQLAE